MPCIPTGSLLTSVVGGVRHSFMWGRRERVLGERRLSSYSAQMRLMYDLTSHTLVILRHPTYCDTFCLPRPNQSLLKFANRFNITTLTRLIDSFLQLERQSFSLTSINFVPFHRLIVQRIRHIYCY